MDPKYILNIHKELKTLKHASSRLYNCAYKQRFDHASKDWKAYRKVHEKLKKVEKKLSVVYKHSQQTFAK
jgi:hypothetical protein